MICWFVAGLYVHLQCIYLYICNYVYIYIIVYVFEYDLCVFFYVLMCLGYENDDDTYHCKTTSRLISTHPSPISDGVSHGKHPPRCFWRCPKDLGKL